jgi:hypothetical protein
MISNSCASILGETDYCQLTSCLQKAYVHYASRAYSIGSAKSTLKAEKSSHPTESLAYLRGQPSTINPITLRATIICSKRSPLFGLVCRCPAGYNLSQKGLGLWNKRQN